MTARHITARHMTNDRTRSVEGAQGLQQVLGQHDTWLREAKVLGTEATFAPVTWSTWDLKVRQLSVVADD